MPSPANFSLAQKGNKLIVKTLTDVTDPDDLKEFFNAYSEIVKKHSDKKNKLLVLLDIRSLTINFMNPKLQVLKSITEFFNGLKPFSDISVAAVSIILANEKLAQIIRGTFELYPSKVPTTVSPDLQHCKEFLKQNYN